VRAGLAAIEAAGGADIVLIHDAARPFVPAAVIDRLLDALAFADGAIPALPVADTLVRASGEHMGDTVDRTALHRVQTPQAFRFDAILAAHDGWNPLLEATDDAQMLRAAGRDVVLVAGDERLEKLTYPQDFTRVEAQIAASRATRVGMGYDVHRLAADEELWLGGVLVPHDRGLAGHSDADVALHAIVDALLGALAEGDIGSHFPPSDPQWRGASSDRFLAYAAKRVAARDGRIEHVDLTLICEAPKIGPHRDAMRARIADILAISLDRVSVKATTTERLGFAGRREGIAAQAVATLSLPALS
jgi:2-C-methyl-D-erythritol 4-phosphate cytidylyltransferase/2-C-methyl-D-erythritol 2,4-cyclodiphosphate synthase